MLLSDVCLTSVCLTSIGLSIAYIGPNSRTERPRKTKIGTQVAHVTRDSDTTFNVKGQLVADALNSQHAGTGATWRIKTKILSTCRGRVHIVSPRAQLVRLISLQSLTNPVRRTPRLVCVVCLHSDVKS